MKLYALLHGTCGLAEGYSETTVRWFNDLDEAIEAKQKSLVGLMMATHEKIQSTMNGMQDIIVFNEEEAEQEILKIIPVEPVWDESWVKEYLVWNQMDCHEEWSGEYLPSDMGVVKDLCERLEAVSDEVSVETFHEFIRDLWYNGDAMFDVDDLCVYYFGVPKTKTIRVPKTKSIDNDSK